MTPTEHRAYVRTLRRQVACDLNTVEDAITALSKLMSGLDDAMAETKDGSVNVALAGVWEALNTQMGTLIALRGRLETR